MVKQLGKLSLKQDPLTEDLMPAPEDLEARVDHLVLLEETDVAFKYISEVKERYLLSNIDFPPTATDILLDAIVRVRKKYDMQINEDWTDKTQITRKLNKKLAEIVSSTAKKGYKIKEEIYRLAISHYFRESQFTSAMQLIKNLQQIITHPEEKKALISYFNQNMQRKTPEGKNYLHTKDIVTGDLPEKRKEDFEQILTPPPGQKIATDEEIKKYLAEYNYRDKENT